MTAPDVEPDKPEEPGNSLPGGDYIRTDCGCGYEVIYTPEGWQHDAAPYLWGDDHTPDIDEDDEAKAEAWQEAWDRQQEAWEQAYQARKTGRTDG
jgi:hypothetical protein